MLAIVVLAVAPAWAGWREPTVCYVQGGAGCFVYVGEHVRILSCAHETGTKDLECGQRIECRLYDDRTFVATVEKVDGDADCAFLAFDVQLPATIRPRSLAGAQPAHGSQVWVCGFPITSGGQFCTRRATILGDDGWRLNVSGQGTPGESGGPIIDSSGDVVGVLSAVPLDAAGRPQPVSWCARLPAIKNLCRWPGCCPGGVCPQPPYMVQPAPRPQPIPQPEPAPTVDYRAAIEKQESDLAALRIEVDNLKKQLSQVRDCDCGDCVAKATAAVDVKIATAMAGIKLPQPPKIDLDAIATAAAAKIQVQPAPSSTAESGPQIFYYDIVPRKGK